MNITSFNITDVGYHYIGIRVLAAMPTAPREEQNRALARNALKYARDRALRLMLPEPKSSFDSVGSKICQELAHFSFARSVKGKGYELTDIPLLELNRNLMQNSVVPNLAMCGDVP